MKDIKTSEQEFIHQLELYLDTTFDDYSRNRITGYLNEYREKIPILPPMVIKQKEVVFRDKPNKIQQLENYDVIQPIDVINKVVEATGIPIHRITSKDRWASLIVPRHVAMYVIRDLCGLTVKEIGKIFNRDHTTVLYALNAVQQMIDVGSERYTKLIGYLNYHLLTEKQTA